MKPYRIISAINPGDLQRRVIEYIEEGYVPCGGVIVDKHRSSSHTRSYMQALYLPTLLVVPPGADN
jgi:hypothetical protein